MMLKNQTIQKTMNVPSACVSSSLTDIITFLCAPSGCITLLMKYGSHCRMKTCKAIFIAYERQDPVLLSHCKCCLTYSSLKALLTHFNSRAIYALDARSHFLLRKKKNGQKQRHFCFTSLCTKVDKMTIYGSAHTLHLFHIIIVFSVSSRLSVYLLLCRVTEATPVFLSTQNL